MNIFLKKIIFLLMVFLLPLMIFGQFKPKNNQKGGLTSEQMDLKKRVTYQTDGMHFSDREIIKLSKILRKIEFSKEWKKAKAKGDSYAHLTKKEKRIYKKITRRQGKAKRKMNKIMQKKKIPKDKNARKQYKKNLKEAGKFNKPKRKKKTWRSKRKTC